MLAVRTFAVTSFLSTFTTIALSADPVTWLSASCLTKELTTLECSFVDVTSQVLGGAMPTLMCPAGFTAVPKFGFTACERTVQLLTSTCLTPIITKCAHDAVSDIEQRIRAEVLCTQMLRLHAIAPEPGFPAWKPAPPSGTFDPSNPKMTGWPDGKASWDWQLGFDDKRKTMLEMAAQGDDSGEPVCGKIRLGRLIVRDPDGVKRCGTIRGPGQLTLERGDQQIEGQLLFEGNVIWWSDGQFWSLLGTRDKVASGGASSWGNSYVLFDTPKAAACLVRDGSALGMVGPDRQLSIARLTDDKYLTVGDKVPAGVIAAGGSVLLWDNGRWWRR